MTSRQPRRNVVILDRDGTVVIDRDYLSDPEQLEFLPGAVEGLRWLAEHGYRLVVVTNQSGVGRGKFSEARLEQVHRQLLVMTQSVGVTLEGIYYCPHAPDDACSCRKPQIGLLTRAAAELGFELASIVVVGDKQSDVDLGRRVDAPTVFINADAINHPTETNASYVARDLSEAAQFIATLNAS